MYQSFWHTLWISWICLYAANTRVFAQSSSGWPTPHDENSLSVSDSAFIDDANCSEETHNATHCDQPLVKRIALTPPKTWSIYTSASAIVGLNGSVLYSVPILTQQLRILLNRSRTDMTNYQASNRTEFYQYDRVGWSFMIMASPNTTIPYGIISRIINNTLNNLPDDKNYTQTPVIRLELDSQPVAQAAFLPIVNSTGIDLNDNSTSSLSVGDAYTAVILSDDGFEVQNLTLSEHALDFWNSTPPEHSLHGKRQFGGGGVLEREVMRIMSKEVMQYTVRLCDSSPVGLPSAAQSHDYAVSTILCTNLASIVDMLQASWTGITFWDFLYGRRVSKERFILSTYQEGRVRCSFIIRIYYIPAGLTRTEVIDELIDVIRNRLRRVTDHDQIPSLSGKMTVNYWDGDRAHSLDTAPGPAPAPVIGPQVVAEWAILMAFVDSINLHDEL